MSSYPIFMSATSTFEIFQNENKEWDKLAGVLSQEILVENEGKEEPGKLQQSVPLEIVAIHAQVCLTVWQELQTRNPFHTGIFCTRKA